MSNKVVIGLDQATVKSVRADMVKGTVALTLEVRLDESILAVKRDLSWLAIDAKPVDVVITEIVDQLPLIQTREFRDLAEGIRSGEVTITAGP